MYWYLVLTCETSTLHYSSFWDWKGCVTYFFNFRNSSSSTAETIKTGIYCTSWPIQHLRYTCLSVYKARNSYICLWLGIFKCQKLDLTDWSKMLMLFEWRTTLKERWRRCFLQIRKKKIIFYISDNEMVPDERHSQIGNSFPVLHVQKLQLKKLVVIGRAFTSRFGKQLSKLKVSQKEN